MPSRFIRVQAASSVVIRQITLRHSLIGRITNGQKILPLTTRSKHSISRSGNHDDILGRAFTPYPPLLANYLKM